MSSASIAISIFFSIFLSIFQRDTVIKSQRLILPQRLELSAAAEMTLEDNLDIFHRNGFEFEIEEESSRGGGGRVKLVSVPMSKEWNFGPSDVEEMLFMMAELNPGDLITRHVV